MHKWHFLKKTTLNLTPSQYTRIFYLVLFFILAIVFSFSSKAFTATQDMCPNKTLETVTIKGIYLGWNNAAEDYPEVVIGFGENDIPLTIPATKAVAEKYFGTTKNVIVEATYDFVQEYSRKTVSCERFNVLKNAKILSGKNHKISTFENTCSEKTFYSNTVNGIYKGYEMGGDFGYISLDIDGQETFFVCAEEGVPIVFGENPIGKSYAFTYELIRFPGDGCNILEVCRSAKPHSTASTVSQENSFKKEIYTWEQASDTASGILELNISTTNPEFAKISINTAYLNSQGTPQGCEIYESCIIKEDTIICPIGKDKYLSDNMDDFDPPYCKNHDCVLKINRMGNTLDVEYSRFWKMYCSMNGVFDGKYHKK